MITLAIPTFNSERYLAQTLASLAAQGPLVRWHLQDGASGDRTVEIAQAHQRPGDTIASEPDAGQTDALNRAFPRLDGEIVGFINGDDLLTDCAVERVVRHFTDHPECDLVYGQVEWIDAEGQVTGRHAGRIDSLAEMLDVYEVWWKQRQWVQPEVFFRRRLWERVGPFDTRYHLAFDVDYWVRCFLAGARVHGLEQPLARFRLHPDQKSTAAARAAEEIRAIVRTHLPAAPIAVGLRRRIEAQLAYDDYQGGRSPQSGTPLLLQLLRHPDWLRAPELRERLIASCRARFSGAKVPPPLA
jgi:glycosyltransferase involved in cell wall biosynthesis